MAAGGSAQDRLDRVAQLIAQNMVAEVCSIYLSRAGGVLELFATEGLKASAVHQTRLNTGEGLVGLVAERGIPLNISEAPNHPRFAYRPETGEDIYHSFLGVPVLRTGKVAGVLVVQNVTPRTYKVEEVEALQTIAMVISELLASGDLIAADELSEDAASLGTSVTLNGTKLADGVGSGIAVFHRPQIKILRTVAEDTELEVGRLEQAITTLREHLEDMLKHPDLSHMGEHREVLETYRMFAYDQGWQAKMREAALSGLTAEAAVDRVQQDNRIRMQQIRDPYLRERIADFEDLASRLIRILQGDESVQREALGEPTVLVARNIGPAELMDYDRTFLQAIVLEEGSATAHVTIIARAMGLPVVGRVAGLLSHVEAGEHIIVDTDSEHVYVRPSDDIIQSYRETARLLKDQLAAYEAERSLPSRTLDGRDVNLLMNAGLLVDLPNLENTGAEGIGLFRTEFQFMISSALPKVDEQFKIYSAALDSAGDKPIVFRTLDIGGDKQVPFLPRDEEEENPAMGWRAIRIALERPALLRFQLRAMLYAAAGRELNVMFPMIAEVAELRRCKSIFQKEIDRLKLHGRTPPSSIKIGCMLEVPSLVWQMDLLLKEVDFLSVGTNDLMQFFFACDRSNPRLTDRYDLLAPPVLSFLHSVISACNDKDVPITVCGEMGSKPIEAMALIGLGLRRLSVSPSAIGPVKRMIRSMHVDRLEEFMLSKLAAGDHSIRDSLLYFARDHDVKLG
ncbi:phosphoenolpyruvate--protein phosphotransferase [Kordiimonas sp. SCSIO 12610]|nr:phosphoenolpyruvate--protein phosphotransferase [Kordiimonas sp. SCSIO 12610]